jgi:hypothetical protein
VPGALKSTKAWGTRLVMGGRFGWEPGAAIPSAEDPADASEIATVPQCRRACGEEGVAGSSKPAGESKPIQIGESAGQNSSMFYFTARVNRRW